MKFCSNCGKEVDDAAVICPSCGCQVGSMQNSSSNQEISGMAIAGLILSFFTAIIGLIVSIIAFKNAKAEGNNRSKTVALAGIIVGAIEVAFVALYVVIIIVGVVAAVSGAALPLVLI